MSHGTNDKGRQGEDERIMGFQKMRFWQGISFIASILENDDSDNK